MRPPALLCRVSAGGHLQLGVGAQLHRTLPRRLNSSPPPRSAARTPRRGVPMWSCHSTHTQNSCFTIPGN